MPKTLCTLCLGGFLSFSLEGAAESLKRFEYARLEMGTRFRIVLYAQQEQQARQASQAAFSRIEELDRLLSDYRTDSELNRVCRQAFQAPQVVSPELFQLLEESIRLSRLTGGAFDVTVGPLVKVWREARETGRLPDPDELARVKGRVGYRYLLLNPKTRSIRFARAGLQIDLGAIAKGFAADQALEVLQSHGIERALIDAGGDIRAGQSPPGKLGWTVSLKVRQGEYRDYLLAKKAIATSGDEFQYAQIGGRRYSHIVDPRSGEAMSDSRLVTVIAPDAATADAWATALSVLELDQGRELLKGLESVSARIALSSGEVLTFGRSSQESGIRSQGEGNPEKLSIQGPQASTLLPTPDSRLLPPLCALGVFARNSPCGSIQAVSTLADTCLGGDAGRRGGIDRAPFRR